MPRPPSLSPELLHTFVAVVHSDGDAAAAAGLLGINQPSMSKRLAHLQHAGRAIRRPWLERQGKRWRLTAEGRRVFPAVEDVLRRYEQLTQFVGAAAPAALTFACGQDAAAGFVLAAVRRFRERRPDEKFRLATLRGRARIEGVANGLLDLAAVTHGPDEVADVARRPLHVEDLFDDPLVLACAESAPAAEEFRQLPDARVPAKALARFALVLPEPDAGVRQQFERRLREAGASLQVAVEVGGWRTIRAYVREGFGVGLLPRSAVAGRAEGLLVKSPQPSLVPPNRVRLICRKLAGGDELDLSEAGAVFREELQAAAAEAAGGAGQ